MPGKIIDFDKGKDSQLQKRKEAGTDRLRRAFRLAREGSNPPRGKPRKPRAGK